MLRSVMIVEDEMAVRARLANIVENSGRYTIVASYARCEPALDFLKEYPVWLTILDLGLPGIAHSEAVRRLREADPTMEILVHTVFDADANVFSALQHGATGYLIKDDKPDNIVEAIDELASGGAPMSFAIARKVMAFFRNTKMPQGVRSKPPEPLTPREGEVLQLLYEGFKYQNIAGKLGISRHTVHDHIKNIYKKLEVHSRAELIGREIGETRRGK